MSYWINQTTFDCQSVPIIKSKLNRQLSQIEKDLLFSCPMKYMEENNNYFSEDFFILNNKELVSLRDDVQCILNNYKENILGIEQDLKITQSWVAKTINGGSHSSHKHPNSMFSCVLYLQTPPNSSIEFEFGNLLFKDFNFEFDYIKPTKYNLTNFKVNVDDMDIVIFPSWMNHFVEKNTYNIDRIILGINSFVFGQFGQDCFFPIELTIKDS